MDLKNEVRETIAILSRILVSGDAVDYMAAARVKLKRIYNELNLEGEESDGGQQNTGSSGD